MRSWAITVGLTLGGIVPTGLIGFAMGQLVQIYGPPYELTGLIIIFGGIALGGLWGRFWIGFVYRLHQGRWPGPLMRQFVRNQGWRRLQTPQEIDESCDRIWQALPCRADQLTPADQRNVRWLTDAGLVRDIGDGILWPKSLGEQIAEMDDRERERRDRG